MIVRGFHPRGQTVYRVRAVDASGILGKVVASGRRRADEAAARRAARPAALGVGALAYQHGGGPRPKLAPKKPPAWYWHWAAWRLAPFHLKRV